jgi:signal transduction histidine kinase
MNTYALIRSKLNPLTIVGYLTLIAIGILGILEIETPALRWVALLLLIIFGLLMAQDPASRLAAHLQMAGQVSIVIVLLVMNPPSYLFTLLFFLASPTATLKLPGRAAAFWIAVMSVITVLYFSLGNSLVAGFLTALPLIGGFVFFGVFANAVRLADEARLESQRLLEALQEANFRLQDYASRAEALAVAEERNRMAREMHDTLGHRLTVASVQLEGAQRLIAKDPGRAEQMVGTVREQVKEALAELRRTVTALRQPLEADLLLVQALEHLAVSFQEATGVPVEANIQQDLPEIGEDQRLVLYRAAQEALTNIQRHAHASRAWLELSCREHCLYLQIEDNGSGLPFAQETQAQQHSGYGLIGLQERAGQIGGQVTIDTGAHGGVRVTVHVPLETQEKAHG